MNEFTEEKTDPGLFGWRIRQLESGAKDHEDRLRLLERFTWRLLGAAAGGAAFGGALLALAMHYMTKGI